MVSNSNQVVCAGRIVVDDTNPDSPGSVVASGTLLTTQEATLLGGVLSGAYYASGTHLADSSNLEPAPSGFVYPDGNGSNYTNNMNVFCQQACIKAHAGDTGYCNAECGFSGMPGLNMGSDPGNSGFLWFAFGIAGQIIAVDPTQLNNVRIETNTATNQVANMTMPTYTGASHPNMAPSATVQPPTMILKQGNGHYAGGIVYEMTMGPMVSICTANLGAWLRGAIEATHAGGIDGHAVIRGSGTSGGGPPERLVCNHRHAQEDLYFGSGAVSPIVINGGTPF